ncbi:hypothetical protein TIFTF001_053871, partial [Ficus carica]
MFKPNFSVMKRLLYSKEKKEVAEQERKWESQDSTSQAQTKDLATSDDAVGVTEDKQLVDQLDAIKIDVRHTKEKQNVNKKHVKIQKVPEIMLRNGDLKKYFKPREWSIGPIHAADSNLYKKELKLKLAACFIDESNSTGAFLLEKIKSEIKDIRAFFSEEVIESYTDEKLLRLVFLDGCAMLGFIHSYVNKKLNMFNISNSQAALIQQDLFLLENQLPFTVLDALMGDNESKNFMNLRDDLIKFTISSGVIVPKSPHHEDR